MNLEQIVPVISLIAVLILVLPAFLKTNSKLKQLLTNLSIWSIIVLIVILITYFIFKFYFEAIFFLGSKNGLSTMVQLTILSSILTFNFVPFFAYFIFTIAKAIFFLSLGE